MSIFITGGNGQLAKSVASIYDKDIHIATKKSLDVTDYNELVKQISKINPSFIFHFASLTRGDECASNPELARKINVEGTRNVVKACKEFDIPLLFVSTNEVFDGRKKVPYVEKDNPHPITIAGKTKWEAEKLIRRNLKKYFIVRTSWLYSQWSSNFIHNVLDKVKNTKSIELVCDEISSPTYSKDLAHALIKLAETKKYGLYHIANAGKASRLDFAKKAFEICGMTDVEIIAIPMGKYRRLSKPPLYTPLDNGMARKMGITMASWEDALERFLLDLKV